MVENKQEFGEVEETDDKVVDIKEETTEESTEETTEETQDTEDTEDSDAEALEEAVEEDNRSNEQKRIDKLTAEKYQERARVEALEAKIRALEAKSESHEKLYTDEELDRAESNTINDESVTTEERLRTLSLVNKERVKNVERKLEERYRRAQEEAIARQAKTNDAWNSVKAWHSNRLPSEYKNNPDFNVEDTSSKLFKLAKSYYENKDLSYNGNMLGAVTDAFFELINSKSGKKETFEEKKLKRKLSKERRKTALSGTGVKREASTAIVKKSKGKLDDYFAERKAGFRVPEVKTVKA